MELRYLDITKREQNTQKAPIRKKRIKSFVTVLLKLTQTLEKLKKHFFFNVRTSRKS